MNFDDFAHYLPGEDVAVILGARAILLPGTPGDALSTKCLTALASSGIEGAIDALFANGLRAAPDFAICETDASGRTRALTRGRGRVEIETARERHVLDEGRLVADHEYTDVVIATLSLGLGPVTPAVPVQGGVVAASAIRLTPTIAAAQRLHATDPETPEPPTADIAEPATAASTPVWQRAAPADSPISGMIEPEPGGEGVDASEAGVADTWHLTSESADDAPGVDEQSILVTTAGPTEQEVDDPDSQFVTSDEAEESAADEALRPRPVDLNKPDLQAEDPGESPPDDRASKPGAPNLFAANEDASQASPSVAEPLAQLEPNDAIELVDFGWGASLPNAESPGIDSDDGTANAGPSWNPADWRVAPVPSSGSTELADVFDSRPALAFPAPPGHQGLQGPDPDGDMELTIARSDLMAELEAPAGPPAGPMVLAKKCVQGHFTVAFQTTCRVCRGPVPEQEPVEISRPALGILRLASGEVITVDRDIVLGRSPREIPGHQGDRPHLARIVDPQHEVSGQHALISVNYWLVSVTDLGSTNGTVVIDATGVTTTLIPDTPVVIEPGSTVVLGEVSRISFEATA